MLKDYTSDERVQFIEQLNSKQYKEVEKFLQPCINYLTQLR